MTIHLGLRPICVLLFFLLSSRLTADEAERQPLRIADLYKDAPSPYWLDTAKNSGAVCVHFLDQRFGGHREYREIAIICPPKRTGLTLKEVSAACHELGYQTAGFTGAVATLKRLRYPAVVRLTLDNQVEQQQRQAGDHFVVVVGWDAEQSRFLVFDPPREIRHMTTDELERKYAGVGLAVANDELATLDSAFYAKPPTTVAFLGGAGLGIVALFLLRRRGATLAVILVTVTVGSIPGCARKSTSSDPHRFDAGKLPAGQVISHVFQVHNRSHQTLKFLEIKGDCRCAKTLIGDLPLVKPGAYAEAKVEIDTTEFDGPTERKLIVLTDAKDPVFKTIPLVLHFDAFQAVQPRYPIYFGHVEPDAGDEELLQIKLGRPEFAEALTEVTCDNPWIEVARGYVGGEWLIFPVRLSQRTKPSGTLIGDIHVRFEHPEIKQTLTVSAVAHVRGDVEIVPDRISMSNLRARNGAYQQKLRLRSRGQHPFHILEVVAPEGVRIEQSDDGDTTSDTHFVTATIEKEQVLAKLDGHLVVRTDHPQEPELYIYVR